MLALAGARRTQPHRAECRRCRATGWSLFAERSPLDHHTVGPRVATTVLGNGLHMPYWDFPHTGISRAAATGGRPSQPRPSIRRRDAQHRPGQRHSERIRIRPGAAARNVCDALIGPGDPRFAIGSLDGRRRALSAVEQSGQRLERTRRGQAPGPGRSICRQIGRVGSREALALKRERNSSVPDHQSTPLGRMTPPDR